MFIITDKIAVPPGGNTSIMEQRHLASSVINTRAVPPGMLIRISILASIDTSFVPIIRRDISPETDSHRNLAPEFDYKLHKYQNKFSSQQYAV